MNNNQFSVFNPCKKIYRLCTQSGTLKKGRLCVFTSFSSVSEHNYQPYQDHLSTEGACNHCLQLYFRKQLRALLATSESPDWLVRSLNPHRNKVDSVSFLQDFGLHLSWWGKGGFTASVHFMVLSLEMRWDRQKDRLIQTRLLLLQTWKTNKLHMPSVNNLLHQWLLAFAFTFK